MSKIVNCKKCLYFCSYICDSCSANEQESVSICKTKKDKEDYYKKLKFEPDNINF
jgi:hypothetical protein